MPSYKLVYFNGKGRGELARLLFAAAGKDFKDERVEGVDWPKLKPNTPQGSMPILEVDDGKLKMCQSQAIARYLAREFNLYGKTNIEQAIVDQIMDTCLDPFNNAVKILFISNQEEKATQTANFIKENVPKFYGYLEDLIVQTGKEGFSVGSSLTVADLFIFVVINQTINGFVATAKAEDPITKFPKVAALVKKVEELPRIKEYLAKRSETAF